MSRLVAVEAKTPLAQVGGKAKHLQFLLKTAVPVPRTWVIPWDVYEQSQINREQALASIRPLLANQLEPNQVYAVRSSANVEDRADFSFAGQFESLLNVQGIDALLEAIERVWDSAERDELRSYLDNAQTAVSAIKMGVIVQEMVPPRVSGVAFSKNPMTGFDETIVEAVAGSGEALVQGGVTPFRWVHKWGDWVSQADHAPIPLAEINQIVAQTKALAAEFGRPVDLEWVWDGTAVYWVQIREISTLKQLNIYSNRISREVLPGIIKPLIWSVNIPLVNAAWIDLFTEMIGPNQINPNDLSKAFHYRAYFNMSTIGRIFQALGMPQETLELMMGVQGGPEKPRFKPSGQTFRHLPRMIRFLLGKLRYGRQLDAFLPEMKRVFRQYAAQPLEQLSATDLLREIDALAKFTQRAAYANIVGPLLMTIYNSLFQRQVAQLGIDYVNFNLMDGMTELDAYVPTVHLDRLAVQYAALSTTAREQLESGQATEQTAVSFSQALDRFLDQFGHLSDSGNDFSTVPWRENRALVLEMVKAHQPIKNNGQQVGWDDLPVSGFKRWRMRLAFQRARQFRYYREAVSYHYTFGYGLFRNYFLQLADRLVARNLLNQRDDIFYLYLDEVRALVVEQTAVPPAELIAQRRAEIEAVRHILLPDIVYGDDPPPPETAVSAQNSLSGIPTSRGYFQGPVRVIRRVQEFEKMIPGAIIVIPYSDVSWTPLFTKAGAVIAEAGGMLSHSSIVAREFGLPAVVSVTGACHLLKDDMIVAVDGYKGLVTVQEAVGETAVRPDEETA